MKKMTRKQFIELVKQGAVQIDSDTYYTVVKLNDTEIEMSEMFKEQLEKEGLYDRTYVGIMTNKPEPPHSMMWLPIYGDPKRYVTKHLKWNFEDAAMVDLQRRSTNIINRYYEYQDGLQQAE